MNRLVRGLLVAAAPLFALPSSAQNPPRAWFVQGNGNIMTFFAGTGDPTVAPKRDAVLFTWTWTAVRTSDPYPNGAQRAPVEYGGDPGAPWNWTIPGGSFPELSIGPGGELWLADPNDDQWSKFLDGAEAALRQGRRRPDPEIGRWGPNCRVASAALPSEALSPPADFRLLSSAPPEGLVPRSETIKFHRFVRWLVDGCRPAPEDTLKLLNITGDGYAIVIPAARGRPVSGIALARPNPETGPSVRALDTYSTPELSLRQRVAPGDSLDLCRLDGFAKACERDLEYRRRLAPVPGPEAWMSVVQGGCARTFADDPKARGTCANPLSWNPTDAGSGSREYIGPLLLSTDPEVVSRIVNDSVQWMLFSSTEEASDSIRLAFPGDTVALAMLVPRTGDGLKWLLDLWPLGALALAFLFWWLFWRPKHPPARAEFAGGPGVRTVDKGVQADTPGGRVRMPAALSAVIQRGRRRLPSFGKKAPPQAADRETAEPAATKTGKPAAEETLEPPLKKTVKPAAKTTVEPQDDKQPPPLPPPPALPPVARPRSARIRYIGEGRIVRAARERAESVARELLDAQHSLWLLEAREELEKLKWDKAKELEDLSTTSQNTLLKKEAEHTTALQTRRGELENELAGKLPGMADKAVRSAAATVRDELKKDATDVLTREAGAQIEAKWKPFAQQREALQHLLADKDALADVERLYASVRDEMPMLERIMALLQRLPGQQPQLEAMERLLEDPPALARVERLYGTLRNEPRLLEDALLLLDKLPDEDVLMLMDPNYRRESAGAAEEADARRKYQHLAAELAGHGNEPLLGLFGAGDQLGHWIERHPEVLVEVAGGPGSRLRDIRGRLPAPAAKDFEQARITLLRFTREDANVFRRILDFTSQKYRHILGPVKRGEAALLERWGLLAGDRPLHDRVREYLEPPERPGRLSEVAQALQYLFEALPVEHLSQEERARLHEHLQPGMDADGTYEFHALLQEMAMGVGLRYHPLPYYRSSANQNVAVREEVTAISLTELVGRAATAKPWTIVRTERPFFFDAQTGIYYAGHANVAQ